MARIACVGDSATAGWPYLPDGGYPRALERALSDILPGRSFEVINLGIFSWDGAGLEAVAARALELRPRVLIYRSGYSDRDRLPLRRRRSAAARAARRLAAPLRASAAWRLALRALPRSPERPANSAEEDLLVREHRARLRRVAAAAREAGASPIFLDLAFCPARAPEHPAGPLLSRLRAATAEEAASLGILFVPLPDSPEGFVDLVHPTLEGYAEAGRRLALALCGTGALAPSRSCRPDRLRPARALAAKLTVTTPEFSAHLGVRLAGYRLRRENRSAAASELARALAAAPNPDLVPADIAASGDAGLAALYREAYAASAAAGVARPPRSRAARALAGLPPLP